MKYKLLKGSDTFSVTLLIHGISVLLGIPTTGMRITLNDKTSIYWPASGKSRPSQLERETTPWYFDFIFKSLHVATPAYMYIIQPFLHQESVIRILEAKKETITGINTASYGKHSFKFYASKLQNILNDDLRTATSTPYFRNNVDLPNHIDRACKLIQIFAWL